MRELLQPLSKRHATLLLTLLILDSEEGLELLQFLHAEEAQSLREVGNSVCEKGSQKQLLPQLVGELKRLLKESDQHTNNTFDPEWLVDVLERETPQAIYTILKGFSRQTATKLTQALPSHISQKLPKNSGHVEPEILKLVFQLFSQHYPKEESSQPTELNVESLICLEKQDLHALIRELGFQELAIAFRGAGRGPLMELCRRLGNEEAEKLLSTIRRMPASSPAEIKAAQRSIRSLSFEQRSKSELIEDAGLGILQNALQGHSPKFRQGLAYQLPREQGQKLLQDHPPLDPDEQLRIQHQIINTLRHLSEEAKVPAIWKELEITLPPLPEEDPENS